VGGHPDESGRLEGRSGHGNSERNRVEQNDTGGTGSVSEKVERGHDTSPASGRLLLLKDKDGNELEQSIYDKIIKQSFGDKIPEKLRDRIISIFNKSLLSPGEPLTISKSSGEKLLLLFIKSKL
jgi:hypothetical protein